MRVPNELDVPLGSGDRTFGKLAAVEQVVTHRVNASERIGAFVLARSPHGILPTEDTRPAGLTLGGLLSRGAFEHMAPRLIELRCVESRPQRSDPICKGFPVRLRAVLVTDRGEAALFQGEFESRVELEEGEHFRLRFVVESKHEAMMVHLTAIATGKAPITIDSNPRVS